MSNSQKAEPEREHRELLARALATRDKAQSRNEYYTADEVLQDLGKVLQKARDKSGI